MGRSAFHHQPRRLAWAAWFLALALIGAQALGLAHALMHGGLPLATPTAACSADTQGGSASCAVADNYGHSRGSDACELWLGLSGSAALATGAESLPLPAAAAASPLGVKLAQAPRAAPIAFDARGPPSA
jgi:hypothetical protein